MKSTLEFKQEKRKRRGRLSKRETCPQCGSSNILFVKPDQFCCDCNWDTCAEYVSLGLMNNIELAFLDHFVPVAVNDVVTKEQEPIFESA